MIALVIASALAVIAEILLMAGFGLTDDTLRIRAPRTRGVYW